MSNLFMKIQLYKQDRIHGASQLLLQALNIIREASDISSAAEKEELAREMISLADELAVCRPGMANITNGMALFKSSLNEALEFSQNVACLKQRINEVAASLVDCLENCARMLAENGARLLCDGMTVMTCSCSSSVLRVFFTARHRGINFKVVAARSEYQGRSYGSLLMDILHSGGIEGEVISDHSLAEYASTADLILIGADAFSPGEFIINGYPSLELVKASMQASPPVPVWSLVESIKTVQDHNSLCVEPGFQKIPLAYFAGVISERGVILGENNI